MIHISASSSPIDLPDKLVATCLADGEKFQGLLIVVAVVMLKKNDYSMIFGPSTQDGEVTITKDEILKEMARDRELFPMDYEDLTHFSGDLIVEPMGLQEIDSALKAYEIFKSSTQYSTGHRDKLDQAWKTIYQAAFNRLEVKIDAPSDVTPLPFPPPAGVLRVMTRSVILG